MCCAANFTRTPRNRNGAIAGCWREIHRLTIDRLRAEIQPVSAQDFYRFLFAWQRVDAEHRAEGPEGLQSVLEQLDGCELPLAAWESAVLAARVADYDPEWLDRLCFSGRVGWGRLSAPQNPNARTLLRCEPVPSRFINAKTSRTGCCWPGQIPRWNFPSPPELCSKRWQLAGRFSSANWCDEPVYCLLKLKKLCPNSRRSAWSPRTVSMDCARFSSLRTNGPRLDETKENAVARRTLPASSLPDAGRCCELHDRLAAIGEWRGQLRRATRHRKICANVAASLRRGLSSFA